jgi:saccharopine dehydrogenase (NAD+, L-lysine forming)
MFIIFAPAKKEPLYRGVKSTKNMLKIGLLREGKVPPDARVPLTPRQCAEVKAQFGVEVVVQPSPIRSFADAEYAAEGIALQSDLADCDFILGVKEVPVEWLLPGKTYLFFSHTIKKQEYNRGLLQALLAKNIRMIDYETLTDDRGGRLIAFGYYAGIVGAHNGIRAYGQRTGAFHLPRMIESRDYATVQAQYAQQHWPPVRVVLTGTGRVSSGAFKTLIDMGFRQVTPIDFLHLEFDEPIFTQLHAHDYVRHRDPRREFDKAHFYRNPEEYVSRFAPYYRRADVLINGIFYNQKAPAFFTLAEMAAPDFQIRVVADISCDIMPHASVPCTIRPSTIAAPMFGFDPQTGREIPPFQPNGVDVMAVDNLPSELPRDASDFFGEQLIRNILPELLHDRDSEIIRRATITENGQLTSYFSYLADFSVSLRPL